MAALALLGCYLLGSIPTAYLLVKYTKRIDIRTVGSGNVGATNALRTAGLRAGTVVLLVDVLKGLLSSSLIPRALLGAPAPNVALLCGLAAVLGHVFPCFLKFRGGKGVATTIGVLCGSAPVTAGAFLGVWLLVFAASRYVSLSSMVAAVAIPISQLLLGRASSEILIGAGLAVLVLLRHRSNLQRLLRGTEHRAWTPGSGA